MSHESNKWLIHSNVCTSAYPLLYKTLRIILIPLLWSTTGKKHSSNTFSAIASLELHSTLWVIPRLAASESSSVLRIRDHEKPASSSCLVPRYFFKCSKSCKSIKNIIQKCKKKMSFRIWALCSSSTKNHIYFSSSSVIFYFNKH